LYHYAEHCAAAAAAAVVSDPSCVLLFAQLFVVEKGGGGGAWLNGEVTETLVATVVDYLGGGGCTS
jgi:exocyst complex component 3